jgi:hypothetical protein
VASLETVLKTTDLDDLLRERRDILSLTPQETERVSAVIRAWTDRQAIANLLFYPDLIPLSLRFDALDRALRSHGFPYFGLAATVGLPELLAVYPMPDEGACRNIRAAVRCTFLS